MAKAKQAPKTRSAKYVALEDRLRALPVGSSVNVGLQNLDLSELRHRLRNAERRGQAWMGVTLEVKPGNKAATIRRIGTIRIEEKSRSKSAVA